MLLLLWGVLFWLLGLLFSRLILELQELFSYLEGNAATFLQAAQEKWQSFLRRIPFVRGDRSINASADLGTRVQEMISAWTVKIPALLQMLFRYLPTSAFSFLIFFLATFYYTVDFSETNAALLSYLPPKVSARLQSTGEKIGYFGKRYLRAYLLLLLLTLGELWVGLLLLRVSYAFGLAFLIAILDFLPVIGVGTVLIPWAATTALFGNYPLALGLVILFAVITVVRQIAEPRILGSQLGLSPLATLCATYIGYRAFGFLGLLLAPAVLLLLQGATGTGEAHDAVHAA
jgi:sporulation integral membrane protein YtvI